MRRWYQKDALLHKKADVLLKDIYAAFGWKTKLIAPLFGIYILITLKKEEERRLSAGWVYEPSCFYEKNPEVELLKENEITKG